MPQDHPTTPTDWAEYLDAASELDRKIGLILNQLESDGLADKTVVIFFGDNGQAHVRGKQFCYESGLRVPLIIRWPRKYPAPRHFKPGAGDSLSPLSWRPEKESPSQAPIRVQDMPSN